VLHAEIKRLVTALSPVGVLRRDALARAAGATWWHEASFELALRAAVEAGRVKQLPLGFYSIRAHDIRGRAPMMHGRARREGWRDGFG
jgi:hypothetical protein